MTALYTMAIPERKPKRVSRKCSTCADRRCRQRGRVCDWRNCGKWLPEGAKKDGGLTDGTRA